jgi:hypothetical protein
MGLTLQHNDSEGQLSSSPVIVVGAPQDNIDCVFGSSSNNCCKTNGDYCYGTVFIFATKSNGEPDKDIGQLNIPLDDCNSGQNGNCPNQNNRRRCRFGEAIEVLSSEVGSFVLAVGARNTDGGKGIICIFEVTFNGTVFALDKDSAHHTAIDGVISGNGYPARPSSVIGFGGFPFSLPARSPRASYPPHTRNFSTATICKLANS